MFPNPHSNGLCLRWPIHLNAHSNISSTLFSAGVRNIESSISSAPSFGSEKSGKESDFKITLLQIMCHQLNLSKPIIPCHSIFDQNGFSIFNSEHSESHCFWPKRTLLVHCVEHAWIFHFQCQFNVFFLFFNSTQCTTMYCLIIYYAPHLSNHLIQTSHFEIECMYVFKHSVVRIIKILLNKMPCAACYCNQRA